ncbi:cysteine desulfurase [Coniella lustricola]|uniref:Cysteine desulfurase n=1 Tax=Coniella lustricola TaxID=2025994 RepID=A0A2T3AAV8_9PEZI|nr:cysteine desulfurase [Coniella lustricola]
MDIRGSFPALARDQVFFDNAGGSQTLGTVIDAIRDYLVGSNVQLGATYATGKRANASYENAYQAAAKYINASRDEIVLGSSTTQLFRNISTTFTFQPGDEIIVSTVDHEANIAPWVDLAERQQLVLKWWNPSGESQPKLTVPDLERLLSPRTRLVTCTHASNILGTIYDLKAIATAVHKAVPIALVCADAVAYAPHRPLNVQETGVDLYAFSFYKLYGPHIALLYARSATAQKQMRSLGHFFNPHTTLENKLGLAGASYELMSGIPAVVDYVDAVGWEVILQREAELQGTLLEYLNSKAGVTILGESSADGNVRVPTVSFTVDGWDSKELVEAVEKDTPFAFRWGAFYSNRLVYEHLDLAKSGVVRVSMVHYNTVDEVKTFIEALEKTLSLKQ